MLHNEKDRKGNTKLFHGFYRGVVVNDQDPYGAGRVRIRVFGVFDDVLNDHLPWAIMADPLMGGQNDLGGFFVPDVDSHVWVFFEQGDHMQPVYFAGAPARPHGPVERFDGDYPRNKVFKTKAGHYIEIDDTHDDTRIHVKHTVGTHKEYQHDGSSLEEIVLDMTIRVGQDSSVHINRDSTVYIGRNSDVHVGANSSVHVEGNSSVHVEGDVDEIVEGNVTRRVLGNVNEIVEGDFNTSIVGSRKEQAQERSEYSTAGDMIVSGTRVDVN